MFTPKDLQEVAFDKAMFGGYDMQMVDEFLEPLTQDYITLYKENAVLKSKLKILVEKLEEYRSQEGSMKKALMSAQQSADAIIAEAQRKASRIMNDAETVSQGQAAERGVAQEQQRVEQAKELAQEFIGKVESEVYRQLKALRRLKELAETPVAVPPAAPPVTVTAPAAAAEPVQTAAPAQAEAVPDMDPELAAVIGSAVQEIAAQTPTSGFAFEELEPVK